MRLKIVSAGEAVLRTKARPLASEEIKSARIQELIEHMRETLNDAPGVGLAAPQIGLPMQLVVIEESWNIRPRSHLQSYSNARENRYRFTCS